MKDLFLKSKFYYTLMAGSIVLLTFASISNYMLNSSSLNIQKANNGLGICFQRITQSFTSLMIQDFSSDFLSSDFRSASADCVDQVASITSGLALGSTATKTVNNLKSDLHWFDKKLEKVMDLAKKGEVDILQSNITGKYGDLEGLKSSLEEDLSMKNQNLLNYRTLGITAIILSIGLLSLSVFGLLISIRAKEKEIMAIDKTAALMGENEDEIESLIKRFFNQVEMPAFSEKIWSVINQQKSEVIKLEKNLLKMNTIEDERYTIDIPEDLLRETNDFQLALNSAIDRVQQKAQAHGVLIDTDLSDDFSIFSNAEALDQLLFYSLSFALDASLTEKNTRKIILRSNPLGGIAYFKMKIVGHSFTDLDMQILNGGAPNSDTNVNLLLLRELISDASASMAVKNIHNSSSNTIESEIEIIFERARGIAHAEPEVKLVKGNKAEIKAYFENQANL